MQIRFSWTLCWQKCRCVSVMPFAANGIPPLSSGLVFGPCWPQSKLDSALDCNDAGIVINYAL